MKKRIVFLAIFFVVVIMSCADFSDGDCTDKAICGSSDGAPADLSVADVPLDTIVKPDGEVPDGECNGGAEDCANGIDDNCNGLVDCADPVCQTAGYACSAPAPAGWTGPVAFGTIAGSTPPSCSGAYATESAKGFDALSAPPATCACNCMGPAEGCEINVTYYTGAGCGTVEQANGLPYNFCENFGAASVGSVSASPGVGGGGICTPKPTTTLPSPTYTNSYAACAYTASQDPGGCTNSALCMEPTPSGFSPKTCVYQAGDVACPATVYTSKTLIYTSTTDSRTCSTCLCNYAPGSCTGNVNAFSGVECTSTEVSITTDGACHSLAGGFSAIATSLNQVQGSCNPQGGSATGSDTPSTPITVCCPP